METMVNVSGGSKEKAREVMVKTSPEPTGVPGSYCEFKGSENMQYADVYAKRASALSTALGNTDAKAAQ